MPAPKTAGYGLTAVCACAAIAHEQAHSPSATVLGWKSFTAIGTCDYGTTTVSPGFNIMFCWTFFCLTTSL